MQFRIDLFDCAIGESKLGIPTHLFKLLLKDWVPFFLVFFLFFNLNAIGT